MAEKIVTLNSSQIVTDRQALLDLVCAIDIGIRQGNLPKAMDVLREPFFPDEITSGKARTDFTLNRYET